MIEKELHTIAPTLSKIAKENYFKVPSNYFDTVEVVIFSTLKSKDFSIKLDKSAFNLPQGYFDSVEDSVISKLKAEALYNETNETIPADYFDDLEDQVLSKIKSKSKIISLKTIARYIAPLAIAASFLLLFLLNTSENSITFESLETAEIEQFIDIGIIEIDEEALASAFSDITLTEDQLSTSLSDEEVLNYLIEENLELIFYND